jgi:DNA-binding GntR family transcriptional regulator
MMEPNSAARKLMNDTSIITHLSLPEKVHDVLQRRILNNELVAGERLIETKLANEFGVSRTTLRSAFLELKTEGLIEISSRRGVFITRMSAKEIEDVCFARYLLEMSAVQESQSFITNDFLTEIDSVIDAMAEAARNGDVATLIEWDTHFHGLIVGAGGRNRVQQLWHTLDGQMGSLMRSSIDGQGISLEEVATRHTDILVALKTKKPKTITESIRKHYLISHVIQNLTGE